MKRALFVAYIDLLKPINFSNGILGNNYRNSGDTVYYSAGISYFFGLKNIAITSKDEVCKQLKQDPNWGVKNFDLAITMEANIFSEYYLDTLIAEQKLINDLKIPFYVLGAGCQSSIDFSYDFLKTIETNAKKYIDSILNSGGIISLRGNFTNECLKKLGYNSLPVLGCPSLYINGADFNISDNKVDKQNFKPMLCGQNLESINKNIYNRYSNGVFFDQDMYLNYLYKPENILTNSNLITPLFIKLYTEDRIKGNMNYYLWNKQIQDGGFNFSYGSRIHGNIIALQNHIPAFVKVHDSRTREMAEFYKIPNSIDTTFDEKKDDLYELYSCLDYSKFNENYKQCFSNFKNFLTENQIPNCLECNNKYLDYISHLDYPVNISTKENRIKFIKKYKYKFLFKKLQRMFTIYKEKSGNKRIIHIFGIKISYKSPNSRS